MSTTQWIVAAIVALLGGGAMGAFINNWLTNRRNRRQPIHYGIHTIDIITKHKGFPSLQAVLTMGDDSGPGRAVNNLSAATITLGNKGNADLERFNFGVTLQGSDKAIDVRFENPDRHHHVELLTPVTLINPTQELDFSIHPFNRGDVYSVSVLFTYEGSSSQVLVSSAHPERLIRVYPWDITPTKLDIVMKWFFRIGITISIVGILLVIFLAVTGTGGEIFTLPDFF